MSGTSADAIDAALVDITDGRLNILTAKTYPLESRIRNAILDMYEPGANEIDRMGVLDNSLGLAFAHCVKELLKEQQLTPCAITAIGSHGQTIRHRPNSNTEQSFTLQIGNPSIIAQETNINTVADFRRRDMACGGQGAPLTPAFHQYVFSDTHVNRAILNIGGIANLTYLPKAGPTIGFDTGPGNGLMDAWIWLHKQKPFDNNGVWAQSGKVNTALLQQLLNTPYLHLEPPKSTGRESFCLSWLQNQIQSFPEIAAEDIQATLLEFTVQSIALHIEKYCEKGTEIYLCGGGAHNTALRSRLTERLKSFTIDTTRALGIPPDDVEAVTFAWLAMRTCEGLHGNLPEVTGAEQAVILGGIYPA